jgi:hypothetical protein
MVRAEAALDAVRNGPVQEALAAHMREQIEARNAATRELNAAREALTAAEKAAETAPGDAAKSAAVEAAKAEVEAKETALKTVADALEQRRSEFDFLAEMRRVIGGRRGVFEAIREEPTDNEGLKDLGELATWDNTWAATSMSEDGDLSTQIQRTDVGCFHFQCPKVVERPLKPFEDIAEEVRGAYFAKQADERAKASADKLEAVLLEQAKAKIPEQIAEIEREAAEKLEAEFSQWEAELREELATAEQWLKDRNPRSLTYRTWDARRQDLAAQLAGAESHREEMAEKSREAVDAKIEEASRKVALEVLDQAVEGTAFQLETLPPYSVNLRTRPRFPDRYPPAVGFLFGDPTASAAVRELEVGEVTEALDDQSGRAVYLAACGAREPATIESLSRRQLVATREAFQQERLRQLMQQSLTIEALKARWKYESPTALEEEPAVKPAAPAQPAEGAAGNGSNGAGPRN